MSMTPFELFLSDEVQSLLDHFAAILDIRVTFFSADGRTLRRGRQMRNSDYCRMVQRELGTLRQCVSLDSDKQQEAVRQRGIIDYQCHAGLREAIAPVFIHDQLAGFLMIGQFRINDAPPECMLERCSSEEQRRKLEQAFRELPRISAEKLENVLGLFKMLIDYIVVRELAVLQGEAGAECFDDLAVSAPQLPDKFQGAVDRTPPGESGSVLDGQSGCDSRGDRFRGRIQRSVLFFAGIQTPQRDAAGGVPGPFAAACNPLSQNISRGLNLDDFPKSRNTGLPRARLYAAARLRY